MNTRKVLPVRVAPGRGNFPGGGSQGACGGERRQDGSGGGTGNVGTPNQPQPLSEPKKGN